MQETCYQYWPTRGGVRLQEYTVDLMEEKTVKGFIMRTLVVINEKVNECTGQYAMLYHSSVWTTDWECSPGGSVAHD